MDFLSPERFEFAIQVLLPGFLITYLFFSLQKAPLPNLAFLTISSVIFSFTYQIVLDVLIDLNPFAAAPRSIARLVNLLLIPIFIGSLSAKYAEIMRHFFSKFGFHTRTIIPSAWDKAFSDRAPCWIIVHLEDGTKVRGEFDSLSVASSTPAERDFYINKVYDYVDEEWVASDRENSVLLTASSILYIEFIGCDDE